MTERSVVERQSWSGAKPRPPARGRARHAADPIVIGTLDHHLGYFLRRAQVWVFQDFIRTLANVDIRPAQYSVLVVIAANPGLSQSDLADKLNIERARLVRLLDKLEKRGLLSRLRSSVDRRSHALHLTRAGQTILRRAKALAAAHEARLIEMIGPERHKQMLEALQVFAR